MSNYLVASLAELRSECRSRGLGADGQRGGRTSWVALASRAALVQSLEADDAGLVLSLPMVTAETNKASGVDTSTAAADLLAQAVGLLTANSVGQLDEQRVIELIREHGRVETHTVVLDPTTGNPGVNVGRTHRDFERLLRIMRRSLDATAAGQPMLVPYLYGPPGTGKTTAVMQAARALFPEQALECDSYNDAMSAVSIFGYRTQGSGDYVETPFFRAFTRGGVYLGDELDKASPFVTGALNMALANGQCAFACGQQMRHARMCVCFGGNTVGLGATPMYPDRSVLPADLRDRCVFVPFNVDENLEAAVAAAIADDDAARAYVSWVRAARAYVTASNVPLVVTPRATYAGLQLMQAGFTFEEARDAAVFKGASADVRDAVMRGAK